MLILSRKINENIVIDGRIIVRVMRVDRDVVKLGIQAPADVPVHRQEIYEEIQKNNRESITTGRPPLPRLLPRKPAAAPNPLVGPEQQNPPALEPTTQ